MTVAAMSNRPFDNFVSANLDFPTARPAGRSNVHHGLSRLAMIEAKHHNLDAELVDALSTLEDIKDSDTLAGLKWYEWLALPVLPLVLSGNKQMIRQQKTLVASLENLVEDRDNLRAILVPPADTFEVRS